MFLPAMAGSGKSRRAGVHRQVDLTLALVELPAVFSPSSPITDPRFLAGRRDQIRTLIGAVGQAGQHAVLYGERGVGKTSVATLIHVLWTEAFKDSDALVAARVQCDPADSFQSIWRKIALALQRDMEKRNIRPLGNGGFDMALSTLLEGQATPTEITRMLELIGKKTIVTIDEFETVSDEDASGLIASTIKMLSDYAVDATLIIVGVADNVDGLIREHASVDRSLVQVLMPRMSTVELQEVITQRLKKVGMTIDSRPLLRIAAFSQGFPNYTHLLGLEAAIFAAEQRRSLEVTSYDVDGAVRAGISKSQQSVLSAYATAIRSPRPDNLFRQTLLACAMTRPDDLGYFSPAEVREPMSKVMQAPRDISSFMKPLRALTDADRGPVLQCVGGLRNQKFRFVNPLLRPYVVFRGISEGAIKEVDAYEFSNPEVAKQLSLFDDELFQPIEPELPS